MPTIEERLDALEAKTGKLPIGSLQQPVSEEKPAQGEVMVFDASKGLYVPGGMAGLSAPGTWKVFHSDGSGVVTEVALGAADTVLTSSGASSAPSFAEVVSGMSLKVKTADVTITSDSTLNDDADLLFAVAANEKWQFEGLIIFDSAATSNFQLSFAGPAGSVGAFAIQAYEDGTTVLGAVEIVAALGSGVTITTSDSSPWMVQFWGAIANGGTAGNLTFRWAQGASSGNATTVHAGSYLKFQVQA